MITASHNPAQYNGIKIGSANDDIIEEQLLRLIQECLNSTSTFKNFVREKVAAFKFMKKTIFFGCDCRKSSPKLRQVAMQGFEIFQITVVDINICTTPQLFSFGKYWWKKLKLTGEGSQQAVEQCKRQYYEEVLSTFDETFTALTPHKGQKSKILLDFGNGSGAVSFKNYQKSLSRYFDFTLSFDKDFDHPNQKCGAEYVYKHWQAVCNEQSEEFDFFFSFDGDSDRVIGKARGNDPPLDGNIFLLMYLKTIQTIIHNLPSNVLQIAEQLHPKNLRLKAVGNINTNIGVIQQCKKQDIPFAVTGIGVQNLYQEAREGNDISVFFQPNGHGGIFFQQNILGAIQKSWDTFSENLEVKMLHAMTTILMNNWKGYALHNMLIFFLCRYYLSKFEHFSYSFYQPWKEASKVVKIRFQQIELFSNESSGYLLRQPISVLEALEVIVAENLNFRITVRKSTTQSDVIKIHVQGQSKTECEQIASKIFDLISNFKE